jgi:hypothetical protein
MRGGLWGVSPQIQFLFEASGAARERCVATATRQWRGFLTHDTRSAARRKLVADRAVIWFKSRVLRAPESRYGCRRSVMVQALGTDQMTEAACKAGRYLHMRDSRLVARFGNPRARLVLAARSLERENAALVPDQYRAYLPGHR